MLQGAQPAPSTASILYKTTTTTPTAEPMTLAIQPTAWSSFDQWGCLWATDMVHARRLADALGEPATIWGCPAQGQPIPLLWA
jgi:hypothetical protein